MTRPAQFWKESAVLDEPAIALKYFFPGASFLSFINSGVLGATQDAARLGNIAQQPKRNQLNNPIAQGCGFKRTGYNLAASGVSCHLAQELVSGPHHR
jgi:hypothetical protein